LKISKKWIEKFAKEYDDNNTNERELEDRIFNSIKAIGSPPKKLTLTVLKDIADWKAPRIKGYIDRNRKYPKYVEDVTKVSLTSTNEKLRIEVLTLLDGVKIRMASAILHFCFPDKYSVMDWRAWASLRRLGKVSGKIQDNYDCYSKYNVVCGKIAKEFGVSRRTLDKALWQWKGAQG
jgi:DNA topoisomerase IB